jgi:hypothetical protein
MTENLRRYLTWFVVFTTILWALSGVTLVGTVNKTARAAAAGDLIKMDGNPAVYYLGSDSKRYVFPNEKTYKTWYANFTGVVTVSQSELESYAIGGNVTYRPGTSLIKITTDPKVYAVEKGGVLRHVKTEAIAQSLYGANWNRKIEDVPDPFFVNYTVGSELATATYPSGTLAKTASSATVYYIDGNTKRPIADEAALNANKFQSKYVVTATDLSAYSDGSSITAAESGLVTLAGPGVTPSTGSILTLALASDSPAASTVVKNAQRVKFTKVSFTASADGNIVIDSLKVKRTGLSQDSNISDVILVDASTDKQLGNEKTLGSLHDVTFNDDITVNAGTTKSYYLAANMASTVQTGEVVYLELSEVKLTGSATVSGTLPIKGNGMTMSNTITIGAVTVAAGGDNPSAATKQVGTTNYIFSGVRLTNDAVEEVQVEALRFYQNGTAADADLANLKLEVDGTQVATLSGVTSKEAYFDLSTSPVVIKKGLNKQFTIKGDIVSGSARTVSFDFEKKTDVKVKGKTYGFYINPTYPNSTTPYFNGPDATISVGTLTASKGTLASTYVAEGSTSQILGAFNLQAKGEKVNVTALEINIAVTSSAATEADVTNLTIYDEAGVVVAGPVDPSDTYNQATSTDTIVVPVGTNKYTVKGDLNTDFANGDTIVLTIEGPNLNITAKGETTNQTITASPSSNITLDTITVKVGGLLVSTSATPAAQTVVAGTTGFTFANFVLDATNSGEDVKISQIKVKHTSSAANIHDYIQNITLYDGATSLNTPQGGESSTSASTATSTITLSSALVVTKGTSKTLALKADISASAANASTHQFGLVGAGTTGADALTATGVSSGTTVTPTVTNSDGQTMTIASTGTLTVATDAANPSAALVTAGSTGVTIGEVRMTASNEDLDVTGMTFVVTGGNSGTATRDLSKVYLYDGATKVAEVSPTTTAMVSFSITEGTLIISKGATGKKVTLKADFQCVGTGCAAGSADNVTLSAVEDSYKAKGSSSGTTIAAANKSGTFSGSQFSLFKSVPTVSFVDIASLSAGTSRPVFKFKLTAPSAGDVGFYKATFVINTTSATVSSFELYETDTDTNLTTNASRAVDQIHTASSDGKGGVYGINILFDTGTDGVGSGGEYRIVPAGGSRSYELRANVTTEATSGRTVSLTLLGEDAFPGTYPGRAATIDDVDDDDFIWSDLYYGNNSTTATKTPEWTNGYRAPGLTSTSTSLTENFNW